MHTDTNRGKTRDFSAAWELLTQSGPHLPLEQFPVTARAAEAASIRKKSILIVDADQQLVGELAQGSSERGYQVETAADCSAAIAILSNRTFDAIILDLQPVGGWGVVEYLRANPAHETIQFVLSAFVDVPTTVTAMRAGVFDVLQKPVRFAELWPRLEAALGTRQEPAAARAASDALTDPRQSERRIKATSARSGERPVAQCLLGGSKELEYVRQQIVSLARFHDVSALIVGETGTGKEVVASAIHQLSSPDSPFVSINCAAIPEELFESELFGYEAGAFTGARGTRPGLLETAEDGTLFLDEVGEMPARLQPKLLRALQTRTFRRVGGREERTLRARIVSATNRELSATEQDGLRSDLYFRLAGFTISLSPLRERLNDLELLANYFLREFAARYTGLPTRFDSAALEALLTYRWPGNVRELRAVVERAAMLSRHGSVDREAVSAALRQGRPDLEGLQLSAAQLEASFGPGLVRSSVTRASGAPPGVGGPDSGAIPVPLSPRAESPRKASGPVDLNEIQRQITIEAFDQHEGNLARAARHLSIPRTTLRGRLRRYGVL